MAVKQCFIFLVVAFIITLNYSCVVGGKSEEKYDPKVQECFDKKCGAGKEWQAGVRSGTMKCIFDKHKLPKVYHPCYLECMGITVTNDEITKCFCEECKISTVNFCDKPYGIALETPEECEALVCSGKNGAQYRQEWCVHPEGRKGYSAERYDKEYGFN